jgi:tetratricopeptide (TPR) repeat protein
MLLASGTASADDFVTCTKGSLTTATTQACTRIIDNPGETPARRAAAHAKIASSRVIDFEAEDFANDFNDGIVDKTLRTNRAERAERSLRPALEHVNRAIALDPRNAQHYEVRAKAYKALGKNDEALADYAKALEPFFEEMRRPDTLGLGLFIPFALTERQDLWLKLRDFDKVIAEASSLIAKYPDTITQYEQRAKAYAGKNDHDRAIADHSEAIRIYERSKRTSPFVHAGLYARRGAAYAKKGDRNRAVLDYEQALRLDPKSFAAKRGLRDLGVK